MNLPGRAAPLPVPEGHLLAGKYRIEKVIGAGGMGVVASAVHIHLGQRVAIKFLLPHAVLDDRTVARFAREARALARIENDHVGRVIDVGALDSGEPFTVLECLSGRNLAEILDARGALEIGEAVGYIIEACQAMTEAHALGIIHRDLKPENLFLAERADGSRILKVIDFGVSKIAPDPHALGSPSVVTATSAVVGSPLYMSPEQLRAARDVDARTDIWSLGVTLYELLTCQGPFPWSTLPELCAAILKDAPRPLRQLRPDVPEALETVVMRCLDRDPARRPQSAAALAQDLRPFLMVGAPIVVGRTLTAATFGAPPSCSPAAETLPSTAPTPLASTPPAPMATVASVRPVKLRGPPSVRAALLLLGGFALGCALLLSGSDGPSLSDVATSAPLAGGAAAITPPPATLLASAEARKAAATASAKPPPPRPRPSGGRPLYYSYPPTIFDHRK